MKKIIVLLMLIISVKGSGQVLQKPAVYGYEFRRLAVDTLFAVPADTFSVPASLQSFPFIARKGTSFYFWNTSTHVWAAFSAAGATPTWQQTLNATGGSVLDGQPNSITGSEPLSFSITAGGLTGQISVDAGNSSITGNRTGATSSFQVKTDTIWSRPHKGLYYIDTLTNVAASKVLHYNPATGLVSYADTSGTVATPTWQQTLTAGSTLTGTNVIDIGSTFTLSRSSVDRFKLNSSSLSIFSPNGSNEFTVTNTGTQIGSGDFYFATATNLSTQDRIIGQRAASGQLGYVTLGSGLSLSSGVLSSSGGTPGGSDTYIQFNDGGSFGGDAGFTYNKTTNVFSTNNGAFRPTGTISFSDAGAGSVYRSSSDGLVLRAVTGSGYDLLMYDAVGNGVFGIEAGTSKLGSTSQIGAGLLGYGSWNAWMNLRGGTTTNASLTIRDGVAPTSPAEGQIWRTTDKVYNVIQTGAATKEFTLNDIALTSGRIPYTTTNGRLTDTATFLRSPGGSVGIGTTSPSASALLDVSSTTKGALMPRMTTTQRDAISSPATGLELFNTTTNSKQIYDGTRWVEAAHPLYKVYTALLTQSGTDAPTATVLENNLGGTVVWTRGSAGQYTATLSGAFTSGKTFFTTVPQSIEGPMNFAFLLLRNDANSITLSGNVGADDELDNSVSSIEIRVYY